MPPEFSQEALDGIGIFSYQKISGSFSGLSYFFIYERDLRGREGAGLGGEKRFQTGIGEEPSAELGPGREGQEVGEVTLSQSGTVE